MSYKYEPGDCNLVSNTEIQDANDVLSPIHIYAKPPLTTYLRKGLLYRVQWTYLDR